MATTDAGTAAEYHLERADEYTPEQMLAKAQIYALLTIAEQLGRLADALERLQRE